MIPIVVAMLGGSTASADELVEVQLTAAQRQRLIEAPAEHMNTAPTALLQRALDRQEIDRVRADTGDQLNIPGWIYYAPDQIIGGRTLQPMVLCIGNGVEIEWGNCQDESYTPARLRGRDKTIVVSDSVDNSELQRILEFVQNARIRSPKKNPILAANDYRVARYRGRKVIGVFASTPGKDEWATVFLQPVAAADGPGTYEITEFTCN